MTHTGWTAKIYIFSLSSIHFIWPPGCPHFISNFVLFFKLHSISHISKPVMYYLDLYSLYFSYLVVEVKIYKYGGFKVLLMYIESTEFLNYNIYLHLSISTNRRDLFSKFLLYFFSLMCVFFEIKFLCVSLHHHHTGRTFLFRYIIL